MIQGRSNNGSLNAGERLTTGAAGRWPPGNYATLSAVIPGLGQLLQGRFFTASIQFTTVVAYLVMSVRVGGGQAWVLAVLCNLWSSIDAYRYEHR